MSWQTAVSILSGALAVVFAWMAFSRNKKHDDQSDARNDATVLVELGHLRSTTDRIEGKQDQLAEKMERQHTETVERLTGVEKSVEYAHLRINKLEGKEK